MIFSRSSQLLSLRTKMHGGYSYRIYMGSPINAVACTLFFYFILLYRSPLSFGFISFYCGLLMWQCTITKIGQCRSWLQLFLFPPMRVLYLSHAYVLWHFGRDRSPPKYFIFVTNSQSLDFCSLNTGNYSKLLIPRSIGFSVFSKFILPKQVPFQATQNYRHVVITFLFFLHNLALQFMVFIFLKSNFFQYLWIFNIST